MSNQWNSIEKRLQSLERWTSAHEHIHDDALPKPVPEPLMAVIEEDDDAARIGRALDKLGFDPWWQHELVGNPFNNCRKCGMPFTARQHTKIVDGEAWPISTSDMMRARYLTSPEAKPFA